MTKPIVNNDNNNGESFLIYEVYLVLAIKRRLSRFYGEG